MSTPTPADLLWQVHHAALEGRSSATGAPLPTTLDKAPPGAQMAHHAMACFEALRRGEPMPARPSYLDDLRASIAEDVARRLVATLGMSTISVTVESLARELHEAGREAVERGLVVNNLGKPFLGWDEITEEAREGRRVQARYLLARFAIQTSVTPMVSIGEASFGPPDDPPPPPPPFY